MNQAGSPSLTPWLGIATIVILLDQLSKVTISKLFAEGESYRLTSFFDLTLWYNPGAAFSLLATQPGWQRYLFTGLGLAAAAFIVYLLRRHAGQRLFCSALSLILGGALGNVIDRLLYGKVTDFLLFHWGNWSFPAFNLADSAITLGAALFVLDELLRVNKK
ncbi:MAG: lipoprotein signal peptidase [Burkholderiaceae bacterium]|nr:lipoprotein signal peptidase [Burkholderiaceae bacterium]